MLVQQLLSGETDIKAENHGMPNGGCTKKKLKLSGQGSELTQLSNFLKVDFSTALLNCVLKINSIQSK